MNKYNDENIIGTLILFSTEYELHQHKIGEEKKQYYQLLKSAKVKTSMELKKEVELTMSPESRIANLDYRDEYRASSKQKLNFTGGHGGMKKKVFNSLIRNLSFCLKTPKGHVDWNAILIILIETPMQLKSIFPHRKIIQTEYINPFINRNYNEFKGKISLKDFQSLDSHIQRDYIKLVNSYLHVEAIRTTVKSFQKSR